MNDNRYNYGNPNVGYGGYGGYGPMWPLIAPWMQMMQAWTCAMAAYAPGPAGPQPWNPYAARDRQGCTPPASAVPKVSVRVRSEYPTDVSACIDAGADTVALKADPLTTGGGAAPPLIAVTIRSECGHVQVEVTVPTGQPAGLYAGAIRDAAGCQRGELTVDVSNPATPRP